MTALLDSAARVRRQGSVAMRRAAGWLGVALLLQVVSGSTGSGSTARSHGPSLGKLLMRTPHALDAMSVLRRATRAQLRQLPFPYLVLDNALPDALYAQLDAAYPPDSSIIAADVSRPHGAVRPHLALHLAKAQACFCMVVEGRPRKFQLSHVPARNGAANCKLLPTRCKRLGFRARRLLQSAHDDEPRMWQWNGPRARRACGMASRRSRRCTATPAFSTRCGPNSSSEPFTTIAAPFLSLPCLVSYFTTRFVAAG